MYPLIGRILHKALKPVLYFFLKRTQRVRVLILFNNEVLLVRNWLSTQRWTVPGGGIHDGEDKLRSAQREINEELGILIDDKKLISLGEYHNSEFTVDCFVYRAEEKFNISRNRFELIDAGWFKIDDLPEPRKRIVEELIKRSSDGNIE